MTAAKAMDRCQTTEDSAGRLKEIRGGLASAVPAYGVRESVPPPRPLGSSDPTLVARWKGSFENRRFEITVMPLVRGCEVVDIYQGPNYLLGLTQYRHSDSHQLPILPPSNTHALRLLSDSISNLQANLPATDSSSKPPIPNSTSHPQHGDRKLHDTYSGHNVS